MTMVVKLAKITNSNLLPQRISHKVQTRKKLKYKLMKNKTKRKKKMSSVNS